MDTTYDYSLTSTSISTTPDPGIMAGALVVVVLSLVLAVVMIASLWKLFEKADKPGWAAIVPIYNFIVMLEIVGRPVWWILLLFVPFVNIVIEIMLMLDFAKAYGKSAGYGVLMIFFPYIMYPVLAFSKDTQYHGPVVPQPAAYGGYTAPAAQQPVAPQGQPVQPQAPAEQPDQLQQ